MGKTQQEAPFVVVIDDDEAARNSIAQMLELRGYRLERFDSAEAALEAPALARALCVITDVKMPGLSGEELLRELLRRDGSAPVILVTGHGDIAMAVRCLKAGAYDFVEKPFDDEVLLASVARAVETTRLRRESEQLRDRLERLSPGESGRFGIVGASGPMQALYERIEAAARIDAPVLVVGETGVGKELVARAIHDRSGRARGPFVPVNAGALPETLLESELFGHAQGAFTGATHAREGRLVTASGGTLLLDEIESISSSAQVKLLRVLEDGLVLPLGKDQPRKVDVRLIATSKVDLLVEVREGRMREDFYHRIVVLPIAVPPLRERGEDIVLLVAHFLRQSAAKYDLVPPRVPAETLDEMMRYEWPGNVRELRNTVERLLISTEKGQPARFVPIETASAAPLVSLPATAGRLNQALEQTERSAIEACLRDNHGEINKTYRDLGISRRALYERMRKYGLRKEDFR